MRLRFLFALGFVLGASVASGEVTLTRYFEMSGVVTAVDEQGRLHFGEASYHHQPLVFFDYFDYKASREFSHGGCLVTAPPESIALIFEGRKAICRTEAALGETIQARCGLSDLPSDSMLSSSPGSGRLSQSEWLVQLGLMRPNCFPNGIFLVALPKDALTSDAATSWQAKLHSPAP